ncbi:MAG: TGS domain-containing protein, partial [bacterium]|nr:TGS domain-containing protein [bacterium]
QRLFRERLVSDFFNHRIFVFSPKGDVVDLPIDSTPIDFAYSIHSDIGDHMTGAKVNGKLASLDTKLHNGDIVSIMTSETAKPNHKWLDMTKTSMARRHIRHELIKLRESEKS